jgi:hypothetical protein
MIEGNTFSSGSTHLTDLPVLVICYARVSNVISLIDQLHNLGIRNIYVAIDGPRTQQVALLQSDLMRNLLKYKEEINDSLHIWQRNENLGVAVSVISAIDWFFSKVEFGAILEDDLLPDNSFYNFLEYCLRIFSKDTSISLISGNKPFSIARKNREICLTNYPQTWGWGTWRNRWTEIRATAYSRQRLKSNFPFHPVRNFWYYGTKRVLSGLVDTWDIPLAYYMLSNGKKSVLPPVNLVSNIGNDSFATHTFESESQLFQNTESSSEMPPVDLLELNRGIGKVNQLLEKNVFRIKLRHAFLPFYSIIDSKRHGFLSMEALEKRLQKVTIPH